MDSSQISSVISSTINEMFYKIFSSIEFQKDKYKFYLISLNLKSESVMLYSDEENYVICRGAEGLPTWIWTKDGFDVSKIEENTNLPL